MHCNQVLPSLMEPDNEEEEEEEECEDVSYSYEVQDFGVNPFDLKSRRPSRRHSCFCHITQLICQNQASRFITNFLVDFVFS